MEEDIDIPSDNPYLPYRSLGATLHVPKDCQRKSIVIIVHGHAGHRDYCYQKQLAKELEIPSLRFDFSGCGVQLGKGTPLGHEELEIPRTFESDLYDMRTVVEFARFKGYFVTALVGHSRGAVACLQYARQDHLIPTVVNCSGRYRAHLIHEKVNRRPNRQPDDVGYWEKIRAGPGGALVNKFMLLSEIASVGDQGMIGIGKAVSSDLNVLICFGTKDQVVPIGDLGMFVNEFGARASVAMVDDADHNFFIQPDAKTGVPKTNKNPEVAKIIAQYLSKEETRVRFLRRHQDITMPRFKDVDGLHNFRDISIEGFPIGSVYRSADLSSLTTLGAKQLSRYIDTIFDLRANPEIAMNGTIGPKSFLDSQEMQIEGVNRIHVPIFKEIDYSPKGLKSFFGSEVNTEERRMAGMVKAYKSILHNSPPVFAQIFRHWASQIRSSKKGFLIHCSAGKDRTGIICAILLLFAGVKPETVALEYELTTHGIQVQHAFEAEDDLEQKQSVKNVGQGSNSETMRRAIHLLNSEFGGVEKYLQAAVNPADLQTVRDYINESRHAYLRLQKTRSKL